MKMIKTTLKTALESIDHLTRANRSFDSSHFIYRLVQSVSPSSAVVKNSDYTRAGYITDLAVANRQIARR